MSSSRERRAQSLFELARDLTGALESSQVAELGAAAVHLVYRLTAGDRTSLRSSLWVHDGAQWRLRFHQGTPEA